MKEGPQARKPDAVLFYLLAESERQLKNAEGAAAAAPVARGVPDDRRGPLMEAQLHEDAGRLAEAEKTLRDLIAKDPLDSAALNFLGTCSRIATIASRGD